MATSSLLPDAAVTRPAAAARMRGTNGVALAGFAGVRDATAHAAALHGYATDAPLGGRRLTWLGTHAGLAAYGARLDVAEDADFVVAVAGRVRGADVARRFIDDYRARGIDALQALTGSFALALVHRERDEALIAIDRMGVHALAWRAVDSGLAFGTTVDAVNAVSAAPAVLDPQSLYNYVFLHMVPGPHTVYRDVRRLPPGGFVHLADGRAVEGRYWRIRYAADAHATDADRARDFRALLERSVRARVDGEATGSFLSGGTDSSTIAGMLARVDAPARTYSIGFAQAGYDEVEYSRIAATHFGTDHHEYYVTPPDVHALAPRIAAFCDQPFGNASAVPTYYCAALAGGDGVRLMLGGDGGDELFGGNERYASQSLLSLYERVPRVLRRAVLEPALFGLPGIDRIPILRKARGYVRLARMPMPERLHAYNLLRRSPPSDVFTDEFLDAVDPLRPLALLAQTWSEIDGRSLLDRMLGLDLQYTLADNDLYKVNSMCELAGVDVDYPMLDDALVAFSARLPDRLKLRGTRLRPFFKDALADFLPPAVIGKQKHGFGLPVGIWMQSYAPLRELAYDALLGLAARDVIQRPFAERIMREHAGAHAAYWGGEIWVLAQLELWLQAHGHAPGRPVT